MGAELWNAFLVVGKGAWPFMLGFAAIGIGKKIVTLRSRLK